MGRVNFALIYGIWDNQRIPDPTYGIKNRYRFKFNFYASWEGRLVFRIRQSRYLSAAPSVDPIYEDGPLHLQCLLRLPGFSRL